MVEKQVILYSFNPPSYILYYQIIVAAAEKSSKLDHKKHREKKTSHSRNVNYKKETFFSSYLICFFLF